MKIFGHPLSTCTRKVLMTLAETGTAHELNVIDFAKAEHKADPYLSRQPFGQLPALDDDGFALYESRAIARYINDKAKGPLLPTDLRARALTEQWISVETSNFTPHAMKFVYHYIFQRKQDEAVLAAATDALQNCLTVMERQLATTPHLAGEAFTLADICYMPYIDYVMSTPGKEIFAKFPHVMAWWNRVSERPTWRKVTMRA